MTIKPSNKELEVLAEIISYNNRNGYPPTRKYIIEMFKLSPKTLHSFFKRYELEGKMRIARYKTRGIYLND